MDLGQARELPRLQRMLPASLTSTAFWAAPISEANFDYLEYSRICCRHARIRTVSKGNLRGKALARLCSARISNSRAGRQSRLGACVAP